MNCPAGERTGLAAVIERDDHCSNPRDTLMA
jgi:hypothetical protein